MRLESGAGQASVGFQSFLTRFIYFQLTFSIFLRREMNTFKLLSTKEPSSSFTWHTSNTGISSNESITDLYYDNAVASIWKRNFS